MYIAQSSDFTGAVWLVQPLRAEDVVEEADPSINPEASAVLWSLLTFSWISPLMMKVLPA